MKKLIALVSLVVLGAVMFTVTATASAATHSAKSASVHKAKGKHARHQQHHTGGYGG